MLVNQNFVAPLREKVVLAMAEQLQEGVVDYFSEFFYEKRVHKNLGRVHTIDG